MPANSTCRRLAVRALATLATALGAASAAAGATLGITQIADDGDDTQGPITVFYRAADDAPTRTGPLGATLAYDAPPLTDGNRRLIVISHGSGGTPWVHTKLARQLTDAGFVVAMPRHEGDHHGNMRDAGPVTWARRPAEVSRAIDAVGRDARLAALLDLDRVGIYGQSAGGHTALSLAGGAWSTSRFVAHCEAHIGEDFHACASVVTRLTGGWADGLEQWLARTVLRLRFGGDEQRHVHHDARIAAVVAGNPYAADFDLSSLARPAVPLGLVTTGQDRWLVPRFHGLRIADACTTCERLAHLESAGHGALLSPPVPAEELKGTLGHVLSDPPGFERERELPAVDEAIAGFFRRHLVRD